MPEHKSSRYKLTYIFRIIKKRFGGDTSLTVIAKSKNTLQYPDCTNVFVGNVQTKTPQKLIITKISSLQVFMATTSKVLAFNA